MDVEPKGIACLLNRLSFLTPFSATVPIAGSAGPTVRAILVDVVWGEGMSAFTVRLVRLVVLAVPYHVSDVFRPGSPSDISDVIVVRVIVVVERLFPWRARPDKCFCHEDVNVLGSPFTSLVKGNEMMPCGMDAVL